VFLILYLCLHLSLCFDAEHGVVVAPKAVVLQALVRPQVLRLLLLRSGVVVVLW